MGYDLYAYSPSVACAAIATVLFLVFTISHLWLLIRNGTYFFSAFVVGGFCKYFAFFVID